MNKELDRERAVLAQEVRLLRDVLDAVGVGASLADVVRAVGYGIKNVIASQRWQTVSLALLDASQRCFDLYQLQGRPLSSYWSNVRKGALVASEDLGVVVTFVTGAESGPASQVLALREAITQRVDGIAVAPINPAALEPLIAQARDAGIAVVAFDTPPVEGSAALLYIGTDNVAAGRLAGDVMQHQVPHGSVVGVGVHALQASNSRQRLDGFTEVVAQAGITVLPPFDDVADTALGESLARDLLLAHPEMAGAFGACGSNGPSWAAALQSLGRAEQVKLVSFDVGADTIAQLADGTIHAVIAQREYDMGYGSVAALCQLLLDGEAAMLARYPQRHVDTGVDVVTLGRSDYSVALADYLLSRRGQYSPDPVLRRRIAQRPQPLELVVIGMAEEQHFDLAPQRHALNNNSFLGKVLASGLPVLREVQPSDPVANDEAALLGGGIGGTLLGVPLVGRGDIMGVLTLGSTDLDPHRDEELAFFERVASAAAITIENARLFAELGERSQELAEAYARQEGLLRTIVELSHPVMPIAKGVLVMPLIGVIDELRATRLVEALLQAVSAHQAQIAILDITGVPLVDTAVAALLMSAAQATRLLGAEMVLVGITPPVAQTLVSLGIGLDQIVTRADLRSGFAYALARTGGKLIYDQRSS